MTIKDQQQKMLNEIMTDLGTKQVLEAEKQKIAAMLSGRFMDVAVETMISMANAEQRALLDKAFSNPKTMDTELMKVASDIPGLTEAIEDAMLKEYELIKFAMNVK